MNQSLSYFNTNNESGKTLVNSELNAKCQEFLIISYFRQYPFVNLTPFEVKERLKMLNIPITSVRRAITNLAKKGLLLKSQEMKKGIYGKLNYCWCLKNDE
jgi:hypothetical protein